MIQRTDNLPATWDEETDLVVVGSGAAGLTGALTAALHGLRVVVLEKTEFVGGTSSISGGAVWIATNHHMAEVGVEDSREEALAYLRALADGAGDDEIVVALLDRGPEMLAYLEEHGGLALRAWPAAGGILDYRTWLPGAKQGGRTMDAGKFRRADLGAWADRIRLGPQSIWTRDKLEYYTKRMHTMAPQPGVAHPARSGAPAADYLASGSALVGQLLRGCLAQEHIAIRTESPAAELVVDGRRVVGVRARRDGAGTTIRARRGVLLATGGYAHNERLKRQWMNRPLVLSSEIDANQGDGHLMGMAIGAETSNLGDAWWMPHLKTGEDDAQMTNVGGTREDRSLPHTMMVNRRGRRFVNESLNYNDIGDAFGTRLNPANHPAWLLFDAQAVEKYLLLAIKVPAEGETRDWVTRAGSLEGLAAELEIDPDALVATVQRFNGFARSGRDLDFGRGETLWDQAWGDPRHGPNPALGTLERPPFYAVQVFPGALATKGGLRIDGSARVLSADGSVPIPGLYAAGNVSSGSIPNAYPGPGATLAAAMTFGYLAGRAAAGAEEPAEDEPLAATGGT